VYPDPNPNPFQFSIPCYSTEPWATLPVNEVAEIWRRGEEAKAGKEEALARVHAEEARIQKLQADDMTRKWESDCASDYNNRVYRLCGPIDHETAHVCIETLGRWHRQYPGEPFTLAMNSPGGMMHYGMELFDFLTWIKAGDHELTVHVRGLAASMAAILLQAASKGQRKMGPESMLLLHEPHITAEGDFKVGEMQDLMKGLSISSGRILRIFADRCAEAGEAGTAQLPLNQYDLEIGWKRTDWWFDSADALKTGLVDSVE
jgi:ATP-dependent protease ClpP protease subunit